MFDATYIPNPLLSYSDVPDHIFNATQHQKLRTPYSFFLLLSSNELTHSLFQDLFPWQCSQKLKYYRAYSLFRAMFPAWRFPNKHIRFNYPKKVPPFYNVRPCLLSHTLGPIPSYSVLSRSLTWPPTCVHALHAIWKMKMAMTAVKKRSGPARLSSTLFVFFKCKVALAFVDEGKTNEQSNVDTSTMMQKVRWPGGRLHFSLNLLQGVRQSWSRWFR